MQSMEDMRRRRGTLSACGLLQRAPAARRVPKQLSSSHLPHPLPHSLRHTPSRSRCTPDQHLRPVTEPPDELAESDSVPPPGRRTKQPPEGGGQRATHRSGGGVDARACSGNAGPHTAGEGKRGRGCGSGGGGGEGGEGTQRISSATHDTAEAPTDGLGDRAEHRGRALWGRWVGGQVWMGVDV